MTGFEIGHLPSGRCGLKCEYGNAAVTPDQSPPFGEVWIEISADWANQKTQMGHLPSGRCGLKLRPVGPRRQRPASPPFGEVWIEIYPYITSIER